MRNPMRRPRLRVEELVNPGDLNRRFVIEKKRNQIRKGMNRDVEYEAHATVWAHLHNFTGRDRFENSQSQAEISCRVVIRYRSDINRDNFRLNYKGRILLIDHIINVGEANRYLAIHCTERV